MHQYSTSNAHFARRMSARFARLLDDGSGDMYIYCLDDARAPPLSAHRAFLSSASESLRTLLSLQLDGASQQYYYPGAARALPRLALHGIKAETMRSVLRHIYTGAVGIDAGNAVDLLVAAEKFGLEALEERVAQFMPRVLRDDNVCDVLTTAAECVAWQRGAAGVRAIPAHSRVAQHSHRARAHTHTHTTQMQQPHLFPAGAGLVLPAAPL